MLLYKVMNLRSMHINSPLNAADGFFLNPWDIIMYKVIMYTHQTHVVVVLVELWHLPTGGGQAISCGVSFLILLLHPGRVQPVSVQLQGPQG